MTDITTLSDRDLLILAAKFCNYEIHRGIIDDFLVRKVRDSLFVKWNPLTDAGDRARACDEHYINVHIGRYSAYVDHYPLEGGKKAEWQEMHTKHNNNRTVAANYAATRLMAMMQLEKEKKNVHKSTA